MFKMSAFSVNTD